jgi:6-phosphofructokinase 1
MKQGPRKAKTPKQKFPEQKFPEQKSRPLASGPAWKNGNFARKTAKKKRIGILTGGGDAPGLNGIIEAASRALLNAGAELIGIHDGFEGVFENRFRPIDLDSIAGIHSQAGTFLGTSNRSRLEGRAAEFQLGYEKLDLEGLIVAGGDGTFAALRKIAAKIPIIGVPKTIDNDLPGTELTFGYDTACSVVAQATDALRATAEAHRRILVVEAMGRTAGWIALGGGLASYADAVLIPERPFDRGELLSYLRARREQGARGLVIVVAESAHARGEDPSVAFHVPGAPQQERYGGIAERLARWFETELDWESRHVVLGHLQRSQNPTTTDRFLTAAMGTLAAQLVLEDAWGSAVVYRQGQVTRAPLTEIQGPARRVDPSHPWVRLVQAQGRFI